jgi:DNA-binding HxlR family transcriptional regulator
MSKYEEDILRIVSREEIKSTNQILSELQDKVKKVVNWHMLHRVLRDLEDTGKVERLKAKAGFFWRKR